jgi:hypothetical protein
VQQLILERYPTANVRVYAIWTSKLLGDSRRWWDAAGLTDRRVIHLWDGPDVAGQWFAQHQPGYQGPDWDTWLLFGPEATWSADRPPALEGSGYSVVDTIGDLDRGLVPLLRQVGTRTP